MNPNRASQNYILFAIIALIIIVGGIFIYKSSMTTSSDSSATGNPYDNSAMAPTEVTVALAQQNASGQKGTATLRDIGGETEVVLNLTGEASGGSEPAHIHLGSCANLGAVQYPLTNVANGHSTTTLGVALADILGSLPLAINVHKSAASISTYVACGDIAPSSMPSSSTTSSSAATSSPSGSLNIKANVGTQTQLGQ